MNFNDERFHHLNEIRMVDTITYVNDITTLFCANLTGAFFLYYVS